jgi:hypothetical protein
MRYILIASLFLLGCSDSSNSPGKNPISYVYGNKIPPGSLPPLPSDYRPQDLPEKVFTQDGKTYAPMNLLTQDLKMTFDVQAQTVTGRATITFLQSSAGFPYLQLDGTITSAKINGDSVMALKVSDPAGANLKIYAFQKDASLALPATLEVEYTLPGSKVGFNSTGIGFLTDMTDLYTARYFEYWAPGNYEEDSFALTMTLEILNGPSIHQLFTNGDALQTGSATWVIRFPSYFTSSSFYVHLTNKALQSLNFIIEGKEKNIPVTLYSTSSSLISQAQDILPGLFAELEGDYGPFAHDRFVAYLQSGGGGMEYSGATITSIGALDHELLHSWFARGVMPADGNSGWIDEAMASWRDYGYFQASSLLSRAPSRLAGYSPYGKSTPENCYVDGRRMLAELDRVLADFGGMKVFARLFFERYKHQVVTTEEFWSFLEARSMINLDAYFSRYIFGGVDTVNSFETNEAPINEGTPKSFHPAPLTPSEVEALR